MNTAAAPAWKMPSIDLKSVDVPTTVAKSTVLQRGVELYLQNGFLVLQNAFDPAFINRLHGEFTDRFQDYFVDKVFDDALEVGNKRTMVTIPLDGAFAEDGFFAPPRIMPLLRFLLSPRLILAGLGCVFSLPGSADQHIHRDRNNIYDPGFYYPGLEAVMAKGAPYAITLAIPLVPITRLTGNTRFWPGTHLSNIKKDDPGLGPGVDFEADIGTAFLFDYRVLHCGVANRSDVVRPLLYNIYTRPWFRDDVNYSKQDPVAISEERYQQLAAEHRGLFAWAVEDKDRRLRFRGPGEQS